MLSQGPPFENRSSKMFEMNGKLSISYLNEKKIKLLKTNYGNARVNRQLE